MTNTLFNSNQTTTKTTIELPNDFQYYEKAPASSNNPYAKFYYQSMSSDILYRANRKKTVYNRS